jgi:type IV secretory pathway VirB3-like protein
MADMRPYNRIVHRSLLNRELIAGIPQAGLFILFMFAVILIYGLELYFMLVPILILYLIMRHFTAKDPWFIDILLENITQKDIFLP